MKKTWVIMLAVCMLLLVFAACGGEGDVLTLPPEDSGASASGDITFFYQGIEIRMGDLWLGKVGCLYDKFGTPVSSTATPSCAYQGMDKTFTYPGFIVKTYPEGDVDYVLNIQFTDDSVATPAGIRIGSSEADLTAAYGVGEKSGNTVVFTKGKMQIAAVVENGTVKNLNYNLVEG